MEATTYQGVFVYLSGFVASSVCAPADLPVEEVVTEANRQLGPTGLDHGWLLSENESFASGETNPCACDRDPSRRHYLLKC